MCCRAGVCACWVMVGLWDKKVGRCRDISFAGSILRLLPSRVVSIVLLTSQFAIVAFLPLQAR
jgi:hypothetical protein